MMSPFDRNNSERRLQARQAKAREDAPRPPRGRAGRRRTLYHAPLDCPDEHGSACEPDHWSLRGWRYDASHGWVER